MNTRIFHALTAFTLAAILCITGCSHPVTTEFSDIMAPGTVAQKIPHEPFKFVEGPASDSEGNLYFNDIPNGITWRYSVDGQFSIFRDNTNRCNGLAFNHAGELLGCEQTPPLISAVDMRGNVLRTLVDSHDGHALNSPNDLTVDHDGGIYFTDPAFGRWEGPPPNFQGVYYLAPGASEPKLVVDDVSKPNGVILSLDGHVLYVVNSWSVDIRAYHLSGPGTVKESGKFGTLVLPEGQAKADSTQASGGDGLTIDELGNLYITSKAGVQVFNLMGERLGIIETPEKPANCAFGGADMQTLFITAQKSLYAVKLEVKGAQLPIGR
jgi:gluconolactonase